MRLRASWSIRCVLVALFAAASAAEANSSKEILTLGKVVFENRLGARVGDPVFDENLRVQLEGTLRSAVDEGLRKAGLVAQRDRAELFTERDSPTATYVLGAYVRGLDLRASLEERLFKGRNWKCSAAATIEWQVFDTKTQTVVFTKVSSASATSELSTGCNSWGPAVARSAEELGREDAFRALFDVSAEVAAQRSWPLITGEATPLIDCSRPSIQLPKDLPIALDTTILVRSGDRLGSGVFIASNGYALTAAHVVGSATTAKVKLASGIELDASVVRRSPPPPVGIDAALLKVGGSGFPCSVIEPLKPAIGADIWVIGTPEKEDLRSTVTKGILSAVRKEGDLELLQTDAAAHRGNSGGPLFNSAGRIVALVSRGEFSSSELVRGQSGAIQPKLMSGVALGVSSSNLRQFLGWAPGQVATSKVTATSVVELSAPTPTPIPTQMTGACTLETPSGSVQLSFGRQTIVKLVTGIEIGGVLHSFDGPSVTLDKGQGTLTRIRTEEIRSARQE